MVELRQLEFHIVDACNLACKFCNHYSDMRQPLNAQDLDSVRAEWEPWAEKVRPSKFILLGGEPTLHKDLPRFVEMALQVWDQSDVWLYTNGFKLEKFTDELIKVMNERTMLSMSLHFGDERDQAMLEKLQPFIEAGVPTRHTDWKGGWNAWYQKGEDGQPRPFDHGNPAASWRLCGSKYCHVLRDHKLWKCPQLIYGRHLGIGSGANNNFPEFEAYQPCTHDDDVRRWALRTIEKCCSHCPAHVVQVEGGEGN